MPNTVSEWLVAALFCVIGTFIVVGILRDKLRESGMKKRLRARPQLDDRQFREQFYQDSPDQGELAVRVRRVLSKNLRIPLDGLRPNDKLNVDLNAELGRNPHLFWELESELGINMDVEELEAFERHAEKIVTFANLVDYAEHRLKQEPTNKKVAGAAGETSWRTYDYSIQSIPYLCTTGWITTLLGALLGKDWAIRLGTCLFLSGFVVWGLANGGGMLWKVIETTREEGFKGFKKHPWGLLFFALLSLFFVWLGASFLWWILKLVGHSR